MSDTTAHSAQGFVCRGCGTRGKTLKQDAHRSVCDRANVVPTGDLPPLTLISVYATIDRTSGRIERWPLDLDAYREGRLDPPPVLANGELLTIVTDYA